MRFLLASLCFHVIVISFAQTASLEWGADVSCSSPEEGGTRPRVVVNGDGDPVILWGRQVVPANFVAVGNDAGFSIPQQITYASVPPAVDFWQGGDLAVIGNEIWTSYKSIPEDAMPAYAHRSLDGGHTWGDTIRIWNDQWTRFASIAIGSAGEPVAMYMQFDDGFAAPRYVSTRMQNGVFEQPVPVNAPFASGEVCDCCPGQIVAAQNTMVPLYRNAGSNVRVIYGAVSQDGGESYDVGGMLDPTNWVISACPSSGPDGYIAGDSIRYVWMSGVNSSTKIYAMSAALTDLQTGVLQRVHPGQPNNVSQNYPRIAGSGDTLGIVWEQTALGDRNILFTWSTTGLTGFSIPDTVNTTVSGAQRTPDVTFADGAFHLVWSDEADGTVHYRSAALVNGASVQETTASIAISIWPVPSQYQLNVAVDGVNVFSIELLDNTGRKVRNATSGVQWMDLNGLSDGLYVLHVIDRNGDPIGVRAIQVVK